MTRINCVPPSELSGKHLVAEYRELPRVFGLVRKAIERGENPFTIKASPRYTLGKGHVKFFYPRLQYLNERQSLIVAEMLARGYSPQHTQSLATSFSDIPSMWWNNWVPTEEALKINRARIAERS